jgi:hypothetical protein
MKHAEAVKRIGRYLLATKDKGLIMKPNKEGMECWVDNSHASEWSNKSAADDLNTARSRMGYVITYAGSPMHWASKMQTEIALSTEAEYIALSQSMREVIPIMWLLQEAADRGINSYLEDHHLRIYAHPSEGGLRRRRRHPVHTLKVGFTATTATKYHYSTE